MVARTPGPFAYYGETHPGVTGDSIRAAVDPADTHAAALGQLADELDGDERRILETTEGDIGSAISNSPFVAQTVARSLAAKGQFAAGCTRLFAEHVDTFDTTVDRINVDHRAMVTGAHHDPDVRDGTTSMTDVVSSFTAALRPRFVAAEQALDDSADEVAAKLRTGPTDEVVRDLIRAGLMPLASASLFPTLTLTEGDRQAAYGAAVNQTIDRLRREGLLTGPDPDGLYRRWLENAARTGVSIDTIVDIAREHHITPADFDVVDGLDEVVDRDGKSFFILDTDMSGDDARRAVLMTYVLNAGTDYGTANDGDTDFPETPYSSDEVQRIIDRQAANSWSYDDDVAFVHRNGGRLAATPNGMMMGLGGDWLQDLYSLNGGTTFGDTFMLNIDDPDDATRALTQIIESGEGAATGDDGQPAPRADHLDLDRLLHHEERHSEQWADEGYLGFAAGYLSESVDVDWKGWGPFQAPVPHTAEGKDNSYEADAGLTDGGYDE